MRRYPIYICTPLGFPLTECEKPDGYVVSLQEDFEVLWKVLGENYCFLEHRGIDRNEVHDRYKMQISGAMNQCVLFDVLGDMLNGLKDGHTNLVSTFNMSRYWGWYFDYPDNFDLDIQENYLGGSYSIAGGLKYTMLSDGQIGYTYYGSFSSSVGGNGLDHAFYQLKDRKGLIFDIRGNGGGTLPNTDRVAPRLLEEKILTDYTQRKMGKGHDDFLEPYPLHLSPSKHICWLRLVIVLTNHHCYSAANDLVQKVRMTPYVTTMGDHTGDGNGFPFNSELLSGWGVRFSASPVLDVNKQHMEFGIDPTYRISMTQENTEKGKDTIIEAATTHLLSETGKK